MGNNTSLLQETRFLFLLSKMFYVLVPCLVAKRLPSHAPDFFHTPVQTAQDPLSKLGREASLAIAKRCAFYRSGTGRRKHRCVFTTTWRPLHPSATSTLPRKVQGNGKSAWISPLLERFFLSKRYKKHSTPNLILPGIREIFKGPFCRQSLGSRKGHRHSLLGSVTQGSTGCPLIRVTYPISCALLPWDSSVTPLDLSLHTPRTHHHRNKPLLMWYAKELELWELHTHIFEFTPVPLADRQCSSVLLF